MFVNLSVKRFWRRNGETLKKRAPKIMKVLVALVFVLSVLAVEYLPGTPTWNDLYAAAGLRDSSIENADLLDLTVVFLDVGQGDCALIHTENTNVLIDTGPYGNARKIKDLLLSLGVDKLDYLIITHQHDDHIGSLKELREIIDIDNEIIPDSTAKMAGLTLTLNADNEKDFRLQFLGPVYLNDNLNNMSLVIKLTFGNVSILFTGDAEAEEEGTLLRTYDAETLHADVLKVGHHGSDTSSTPEFIAAVSPTFAVISVGADNDYGHPHAQTLETLQPAEIHRTDLEGTIIFTTDGKTLSFHRLE